MSGPYVFVPPTPHIYPESDYVQGAVFSPGSPFIPNSAQYLSPYTDANIPLPGSPTMNSTFPNTPDTSFPNFPSVRRRRLSWHGPHVFTPTFSVQALPPESPDPFLCRRQRRHSFSNYPLSPYDWDTYVPLSGVVSASQLQIHPWLNAQTWNGQFLFNLSSKYFNPLLLTGPGITQPAPMEMLLRPATHPPLNRLRIVCNLIPQWPIDLCHHLDLLHANADGISDAGDMRFLFDTTGARIRPPITLMDILTQLHRMLNMRVSHSDWEELTHSEAMAVARMYRRRCRAMGSVEAVQAELAQGVRRVDFLLGKVWFKGCVVDLDRGVMKLIVG